MKLLEGIPVAQKLIHELAEKVHCHRLPGKTPKLAIVLVGNNPASEIYVKQKQKKAADIGMACEFFAIEATVSQSALHEAIENLNQRNDIHGIIVQAPLPSHLNEQEAFNAIHPNKDVDGFNAINVGKLCQDGPLGLVPCTPLGILTLLHHYQIPTEGRHVVIVGRSLIVGKPLSLLFLSKQPFGNATVSIAHSKTRNLGALTRQADILIAATGKPHLITHNDVKPGAVVIDVGINRIPDATAPKGYAIVGDVDFKHVAPIAGAITPVPGGVGPLTVALLLQNTFKAYCAQNQIHIHETRTFCS